MSKSRIVLTPEIRLSFPNLITPKEFKDKTGKGTGKFYYGAEMLIPEESLDHFRVLRDGKLVDVKISELLFELAKEAWPDEKSPEDGHVLTIKEMFSGIGAKGWPLKKGDVIADKLKAKGKNGEHYRGMRVMSCKCNVSDKVTPPTLSLAMKGGAVTLNRLVTEDMQKARNAFVGGNYAVAELNIVASFVSNAYFLVPYLNEMRYTRDGAKFGGQGGTLMSKFEGISGGESDHNPMDGMDDEIPF